MSHIIYGQNKIICHFELADNLLKNENYFLQINQLVLLVHHYQYPCVHYEKIFNHFRSMLPQNTSYLQIRLVNNGEEIPSDLPLGLFIDKQANIKVTISPFQISDPYSIIKQSWKKAFSGVNPNKGCNYLYKQLKPEELRNKIQMYFNGQAHNFQNQQFEGYEGKNIVTRFFIQGQIIERKSEANEDTNVQDLIRNSIPQVDSKKIIVKSHGAQFDLGMSTKQFLDQWSYNDGFCYLTILVQQ